MLNLVVIIYTACCNIKGPLFLEPCIYLFLVRFLKKTNTDFFPMQISLICLHNWNWNVSVEQILTVLCHT